MVDYLQTTYYVRRNEWSRAWIQENRNWGISTTSRVESAHKDLKTILVNPFADLTELIRRISLHLSVKDTQYKAKLAHDSEITMNHHRRQEILKNVNRHISRYTIDLFWKQYLLTMGAYNTNTPMNVCSGFFQIQYGIPCCHEIYSRFVLEPNASGKPQPRCVSPCDISDFDPHWYVSTTPLEAGDIRLIRDPTFVKKYRKKRQITTASTATPSTAPATPSTASVNSFIQRTPSQQQAAMRIPSLWEEDATTPQSTGPGAIQPYIEPPPRDFVIASTPSTSAAPPLRPLTMAPPSAPMGSQMPSEPFSQQSGPPPTQPWPSPASRSQPFVGNGGNSFMGHPPRPPPISRLQMTGNSFMGPPAPPGPPVMLYTDQQHGNPAPIYGISSQGGPWSNGNVSVLHGNGNTINFYCSDHVK